MRMLTSGGAARARRSIACPYASMIAVGRSVPAERARADEAACARTPRRTPSSSSRRAIAAASSSGLVRDRRAARRRRALPAASRGRPRRPARRASSPRAPACRSLPRTTACTSSRAPSYSARRSAGVDVADVADAAARAAAGRSGRATAWPRRSPCRRARAAGTASGRCPAATLREPLVRVEQPADVLARLERAEEQHVPVCRRARPAASSRARPAGRPRSDPRGTPEQPLDLAGGELPTATMIRVGALRVRARERRVVAADLRARPLRMRRGSPDRES